MTESTLPFWYDKWLNTAMAVNQRQVFFIVGCQKSGTSWVQKLLNAHPQIACHGEGHLGDTAAVLLRQALMQYNQSQQATARLTNEMLLDDEDLLGLLKVFCDRQLASYIALESGHKTTIHAVGDKTPEHANAIDLLRRLYPASRFIHIIRDGRDAAVSGWAHLQRQSKAGQFNAFADYAEYFAARHWKPYITNARTAGDEIGAEYLEVRYEQLHEQSQHHVQHMLQLLGLDDDDDVVQTCVDSASFTVLTGGRSPGAEDRSAHLRKGIVGDWQTHFDDDAVRRFDDAAGDLLDALGYRSTVLQ